MFLRIVTTICFVYVVYKSTPFFHHYIPNTVPAMENLATSLTTDLASVFYNHSYYGSLRKFVQYADKKLSELEAN